MYGILVENFSNPVPKIAKNVVTSTVTKAQEGQRKELENQAPPAKAIATPSTLNNDVTLDLSNIDLLEFDDQMLVQFLNENEKLLQQQTDQNSLGLATQNQIQHQTIQNIQHNTVSKPTNFAVLPKMFFPHSNVTINYNFNK